jgi:hypothetical protein
MPAGPKPGIIEVESCSSHQPFIFDRHNSGNALFHRPGGNDMRKALIPLAVWLSISGCEPLREQQVANSLNTYMDHSVADLSVALGPPTTKLNAGSGKTRFQWDHYYGEAQSAGAATPAGNAVIAPPQTWECRVSAVAHTSATDPSLNDWIIEHLEYTGPGCV